MRGKKNIMKDTLKQACKLLIERAKRLKNEIELDAPEAVIKAEIALIKNSIIEIEKVLEDN